MNQYQNEKLSEEQKRKLHELHMIQQRELQELIRRHQEEQLRIFEQWKREDIDSSNQSKHMSQKDKDEKSYSQYKPYTLSQYKLLKLQPILKNPGQGLGPTMSIEKWQLSKEKMDRMLEFAEHVKVEHRQFKQQRLPKSEPKQITVRQRGIEFAKQTLKPILPSQIRKKSVQKNVAENDDLLEFELRNQMLKEQIGKMK